MKKILFILAVCFSVFTAKSQAKYYLTDQASQPWGSPSNVNAMNQAFGVGGWTQGFFQTINVNALLQPTVCLIYCDGGSMAAASMNTFLVANMAAIQTWVFNGGRLFLNAGPNTGGNMNYGFGGITLNYVNGGPYSTPGAAVNNAHPIYVGPFAITSFTHSDNFYCHGYVTGPGMTPIICNTTTPWTTWGAAVQPTGGNVILASKAWGAGMCLFGSMTNTSFHNPAPSCNNLRANMLVWLNVCCTIPTITAVSNPTAVCAGQPATLTAGGAGVNGTYTWNPGALVGSVVVVSPSVTTTYTASGTTSLGCVGTRTVQLVVNPSPTVSAIVNPTAICIGNSATVTLSGANSYTTNVGNLIGSPIVLSPTVTTTYTTTGTSTAGCVGTGTFQILVNPLPVVTPTNNGPICTGGLLNLGVGAANSYSWTGPGGYVSNIQNPFIASAQATNAGVYTVSVTNANGCTSSGTTQVIVNPVPVITPTNTGPYCQGGNILLQVGANNTYSWTGPNGFVSNVQNPVIFPAQVIQGGVYTVSVTAVGGCMSTGTTNVIVNPTPTINAALSSTAICINTSATVSLSGANTYTTNPGNLVGPSVVLSPTVTTTYTTSGTSTANCVGTTTFQIIVNPLPVIPTSNPLVCLNQSINLISGGGVTYSWSGPLAYTSPAQNPVIPNAQLNMGGAYTVTVTTANGCTASAVSNVTVITLPNPIINSTSPNCVGSTLSFTGSGGATYNWSGPNGFTSGFQNPSIANVQLAAGGVYTLIVTAGTCSNVTTASVTINPLPTPTAISNSPVCLLQPINFTGSGGTTYTWTGPGFSQPNNQNPTISVAQNSNAGVYTLSVTNANGCVNFTTTNVVINPLPVINTNSPTVCVGTNINLTSNGGVVYNWSGPGGFTSPVQNPVIANAQTTMSGVYNVTVSTALGCTAQAASNVSVIPLPQPNANSSSPNCVGSNLQLLGSGGVGYSWTGPNGFVSGSQNPVIGNVQLPANGIYTLVVTAGTCSNVTTTSVTINPLPTPNIISNSPVCLLQPINLTGAGGVNYSWSGPGGFTSPLQAPSIAVAQNTNAGNYTLTVTDANNCSNSTSVPVVINPLPNISTGNVVVCENTMLNLFANGANTYTWSGPGGFASNAQNPFIAVASQSNSGAYLIMGSSGQGCTNTAVSNVTVLPLPVPVITASDVCIGFNLNLIGNGGTSYIWAGPNGFTSNISTPMIPNAPLAASGVYTLVVSAGNCTASTTQQVNVHPLPTPTLTSNSPICLKEQIQMFGSGGNTYTWIGPNNFSATGNNIGIPNAGYSHVGTYTATATDQFGCVNTATLNIAVNSLPVIGTKGATLCANTTGSLSASGGTGYAWSGPLGFSAGTASVQMTNVTVDMSGDYTVTVTDINACKSTSVVNMHVNPIPEITTTGNSPLCEGQTIILNANSPTGVTYFWQGPNGVASSPLQNPKLPNASPNATGIFTVSVFDNIGCMSQAFVNVEVKRLPVVKVTSDIANGCVPICVNFNSQSTSSLTTGTWEFGDGGSAVGLNAQRCFDQAGTYVITSRMTDNFGCSNTATFNVEAYPIPVADFNYTSANPIINESVEFSDASWNANVVSWTWNFNHLKSNAIVTRPVVNMTYPEAGTYVAALIVSSNYGCKDTVIKAIVVGEDFGLYIPDAFSPNGDGLNDTFQPKGFGITKFTMDIFDRWGERIFTTSDFETGWDGTFPRRGNQDVKQDVYVWHIKLTNVHGKSKELSGKVSIIK